MEKFCPVSCRQKGNPGTPGCHDVHARCNVWAQLGECEINQAMKRYCPKSCDNCGGDGGGDGGDDGQQGKVQENNKEPQEQPEDDSTTDNAFVCVDNHSKCSKWAVRAI
jgi:ShK domain-like